MSTSTRLACLMFCQYGMLRDTQMIEEDLKRSSKICQLYLSQGFSPNLRNIDLSKPWNCVYNNIDDSLLSKLLSLKITFGLHHVFSSTHHSIKLQAKRFLAWRNSSKRWRLSFRILKLIQKRLVKDCRFRKSSHLLTSNYQ